MSHPLLAVASLVGRILVLYSLLMLLPLAFAWFGSDGALGAFAVAILVTLGAGVGLGSATRRARRELQPRDGFLLVSLIWSLLPAFGALPLLLALDGISVTDAYFEAMSGFSATGATALSGLDAMPLSINVWRCLLNYVGGLGIVVLAVAVLPMLGVGGTQLFRAETPGPMKDQKLTPRIASTARGLWTIYAALSVACFAAYRAAGMSWEDAFVHMLSTVSLGGLSSHDASFAYWNSAAIELVAMCFMMLSGVNFALFFVAWRRRSLRVLAADAELRAYVGVVLGSIALLSVYLTAHGQYPRYADALRHAAFNVVSIATTGGYSISDYALWPPFAGVLMLGLGCFATCAGSTGGGIKMIRMLLLLRQSQRELVRIVHPNVVNPVVLGATVVPPRVLQSVLAYMLIYGATILTLTMLLLFSGLDIVTAFTAVIACVNNIGPGLGAVGPVANYSALTDFQTWVCTIGMLVGRIELLPVLVLLTRQFWRG